MLSASLGLGGAARLPVNIATMAVEVIRFVKNLTTTDS
jgi:hypothetical protein